MTRLQTYWAAVRTKQSELIQSFGPCCFVVSTLDGVPGGKSEVVFEVSCEHAAQAIIGGSHELATEAQVAEYKASQERRRLESLRHEAARGGADGSTRNIYVAVPPAPKD